MERLNNCRICLEDDIPLRVIVGTHLQEMYETLTLTPLETKDSRPTLACYICCAKLQNCYRLRFNCLQSEELLTQILSSNVVQSVAHKTSYKNTIKMAHPVVHLSMGDDFQMTSDSDCDEEASGDVDNDKMKEDVQASLPKSYHSACQSESSNDGSIPHTNTQDLLDFVKEEMVDMETEAEDSDMGESSNGGSISYTNTQDLLDIVKEEIVNVETGVPVPKKTRHTLEKSLVNLEAHKKYEKEEEIHKIEPLKSDTAIAYEFKHVTKKESVCVKETHDKVFKYINSLTETNRTWDHNYALKIISEIEMTTDVSVSNISVKGLNQHICDICKKCFNVKGNLHTHIRRVHSGEKPYQCDVCKKCFKYKGHFHRHIRIHTGERPYQCDICKKCFNEKGNLDKHIRIHSGEKPYQCDVCKKRFTQSSTLGSHIRTHTGERPYQCDICKKCFNFKSSLNRHIRFHSGENPYQCVTLYF